MAHKGSSHLQTLINRTSWRNKSRCVVKPQRSVSSLWNTIQGGGEPPQKKQVTETAATLSLQITKLHFLYRPIDCTSKLNTVISCDSEKATVINVLAAHSADMAI